MYYTHPKKLASPPTAISIINKFEIFENLNVVKKKPNNSKRCIIKKLLKNNTYKTYHSEANTYLLLATLTRRLFLR